MMTISLKKLSRRQCRAWELRNRRGWRMKRIAMAMGVRPHAVSQLLKREMLRAGSPWRANLRALPTMLQEGNVA